MPYTTAHTTVSHRAAYDPRHSRHSCLMHIICPSGQWLRAHCRPCAAPTAMGPPHAMIIAVSYDQFQTDGDSTGSNVCLHVGVMCLPHMMPSLVHRQLLAFLNTAIKHVISDRTRSFVNCGRPCHVLLTAHGYHLQPARRKCARCTACIDQRSWRVPLVHPHQFGEQFGKARNPFVTYPCP